MELEVRGRLHTDTGRQHAPSRGPLCLTPRSRRLSCIDGVALWARLCAGAGTRGHCPGGSQGAGTRQTAHRRGLCVPPRCPAHSRSSFVSHCCGQQDSVMPLGLHFVQQQLDPRPCCVTLGRSRPLPETQGPLVWDGNSHPGACGVQGLTREKSPVLAEYPAWCSAWVDVSDVRDPVRLGVLEKEESDHTHGLRVRSTLRPGLPTVSSQVVCSSTWWPRRVRDCPGHLDKSGQRSRVGVPSRAETTSSSDFWIFKTEIMST